MRVVLSLLILTFHASLVSYGPEVDRVIFTQSLHSAPLILLPMFFVLSGFLVSGSVFRTNSVPTFLAFRVLRIVPALFTEICISAILLGALTSTLPLRDYLTNPEFVHYFTNIVGWINFTLPGVFAENPFSRVVNLSLWTIPWEILCYVVMLVLMMTRLIRDKWLMLAVFVAALVLTLVSYKLHPNYRSFAARELVTFFLGGSVAYLWRDSIPLDWRLCLVSVVSALALIAWWPAAYLLPIIFVVYITVYLGFVEAFDFKWLGYGDYSYGIYLYAFPVQQMVAFALPAAREWYWNLLIAAPITVLIAMLSWHFVELPALTLKKYVVRKRTVPQAA